MMRTITVRPAKKLEGVVEVPGDKSISQRAVMIGSIAEGTTRVTNFLMGDDCVHAIKVFRAMGITIKEQGAGKIIIEGKGLRGLRKPKKLLYVGNSGTTMRILSGILAGQQFECEVGGDASLSKRPMMRVAAPLTMMGAHIRSKFKVQR